MVSAGVDDDDVDDDNDGLVRIWVWKAGEIPERESKILGGCGFCLACVSFRV